MSEERGATNPIEQTQASDNAPVSSAPATSAPVVESPATRTNPRAHPGGKWERSTKRTVLFCLLGAFIFAIWLSLDVLPWLIIAAIISYLVSPIVGLLTRLRIPRTLATVMVFIVLGVLMVLLPILLTPVLLTQLTELATFDVTRTATSLFNWMVRSINELPQRIGFLGFEIPTDNVIDQLNAGFSEITFVPTLRDVLGYIQSLIMTATGIVSSTAAISVAVVTAILQFLAAIIIIYFMSMYITKDLPGIRSYFEALFPQSFQPELRELLRRMGYIWSSFFRGQLILSFAVGGATWMVLTLVGMPGALILAITAGMLEVIPQFGPIVATIPAVIVALIQGSPVLAEYGVGNVGFALITVGIYFVIQQVEASVLVPRIIGDSVNLHPVIVIMGVMVGLSTFGILGAFLAAPLLASLRVLGSYIHAKLLDYPPFQTEIGPVRQRTYRRRVRGDQPGAAESVQRAAAAAGIATRSASGNPSIPLPELPPGSPPQEKDISDSAARPSSAAS